MQSKFNNLPLIFLDTETTGNILGTDRLCQVCYQAGETIRTEYFKPPMPVSVKSMSINHITNEMLADKPAFAGSSMAKDLQKLLEQGILVAHNAKFDISMLESEGISVPRFICTFRMARYLDKENAIPEYGLQFLRYYLHLDVTGTAHDAEGDVRVLAAIFPRLLAKMTAEAGSEAAAIERMMEISRTPVLFTKFNFGKYNGKTIEEVLKTDRRYLEWLFEQKRTNEEGEEDWLYTLRHYLDK